MLEKGVSWDVVLSVLKLGKSEAKWSKMVILVLGQIG